MKKQIIIAISGASGAIYGIRMLEILKEIPDVATHLIISKSANITIKHETNYKISNVKDLADFNYSIDDIAACISSGSFKTFAMIIAPCSAKTMAQISNGIGSNLITRAADVILKERKKLLLMIRETPFHTGHLLNMTQLSQMGGIICPPLPAFYNSPKTIDDIVNHSVGRTLDLIDIDSTVVKRWQGI